METFNANRFLLGVALLALASVALADELDVFAPAVQFDLFVVDEEGGGPKPVPIGNPSGMALYRMDGLGGPCVRLGESPTSATGSPELSPDGKRVAFDGWQDHLGQGTADSRLYVFDMSDPSKIFNLGPGAMPSWAPRNLGIAYSGYVQRGVNVMDPSGEGRTSLDGAGWSAEWSPDGDKIAYTRHMNGEANVVVYDVRSAETKSLLAGDEFGFIRWGFSWSPDSKQLCVMANKTQGGAALVVIDTQGDEFKHRVISEHLPEEFMEGVDTPIAWGGDGERVMFRAANPSEEYVRLHTLEVSGESQPEVVPGLPEQTASFGPHWHPNGTIVFVGVPAEGPTPTTD